MQSMHWITLGVGVLIGWFVLPIVLGMLSGHMQQKGGGQ